MSTPSHVFRRRLTGLIGGLAVAVVACLLIAVAVHREASEKLQQLAHVELDAMQLSRQFGAAIDDLHGALLRIGTEDTEDNATIIQQRQQELTEWIDARQRERLSAQESQIIRLMAVETKSYFGKLDALKVRTNGWKDALDRDTVVMFDDSVNRLQSMSDEFAGAHNDELRQLLQESLASLRWMRNLVFTCLALLLAAIAGVVALLYGGVVRPLREQLVDSEALLAKREKLAALGTLAAGVAHEIRNPLTAIKARLYTLRRQLSTDESKEDVQAIAQEVDRLERIVRDVLGYARPAEATLESVDLAAWLGEFSAFVQPELSDARIDLVTDVGTSTKVAIDANQLRQIMLNLVRNARESFEEQPGRIELALRCAPTNLRGKPAKVAMLSVSDNGPGIPAHVQARLFDPFFTTKSAGTGLGLSIVARLVENLGGEIRFQSAPGAGTKFVVCLPISEPPGQNPRT